MIIFFMKSIVFWITALTFFHQVVVHPFPAHDIDDAFVEFFVEDQQETIPKGNHLAIIQEGFLSKESNKNLVLG